MSNGAPLAVARGVLRATGGAAPVVAVAAGVSVPPSPDPGHMVR
ncbi:MAG: hypothetical protein K0R62_7795 [Nonomuraea muscovyensis]|nr:hypothetical protein [Nonomuraea muscovyensis]